MTHPRTAALRVALVAAGDASKEALCAFVNNHEDFFARHDLIGTSGTSAAISARTGLAVRAVGHGPQGGDVALAHGILSGEVDLVIFLRSGMETHPHEDDIRTLMRTCNLSNCPLATNLATADLMVTALQRSAARTRAATA